MTRPFFFSALAVMLVLWIGAIATAWVGWGPWAAYSHIHAIIASAIAAGLFLLARRGVRRSSRVDRTDAPFAAYPLGQVLAIFDDRDCAAGALAELRQAVPHRDLVVFSSSKGAASLDSEGTGHGIAGVTERSIEHLLTDEDDLQRYDTAVRAGAVVVSMEADRDAAGAASDILRSHGGYDIYHFGSFTVQKLDV